MSEYATLRGLLEHHVKTMRLRPEASFPSEAASAKEFIKGWQRAQQHGVLREAMGYGPDDRDDGDWDAGDSAGSSLLGA